MNGTQVIVMAKAPVPGRVKTRLCPPCTPEGAAAVAAAALADTLDVVTASRADRRILAVDGHFEAPPGWEVLAQRGGPLGVRLANAFADAHRAGTATVLVGMDTPQLSGADLDSAFGRLSGPDGAGAVLGPAGDGGWWLLGLRDGRHASVLAGIETSTADTGAETREALTGLGLRVAMLRTLTDVDTAVDARAVAGWCPAGARFPAAVSAHVPAPAPAAGGRSAFSATAAVAGAFSPATAVAGALSPATAVAGGVSPASVSDSARREGGR